MSSSLAYKASNDSSDYVIFTDASCFEMRGKYHKEDNYKRLPAEYKDIVSSQVWTLSKSTAGISIRFSTNSPFIYVKWRLLKNDNPTNMNKIGSCGLDLYCIVNGKWQYVNSAVPSSIKNNSLIITGMDTTMKTFLLNLPISDGVEDIQFGTKRTCKISLPTEDIDKIHKPIVFYGTSLTQGIGASRPGMAYPSIISRALGAEIINLGFSGNGKFEHAVGQVLCDIDAELYVIDCTPNSTPAIIKKNALQFIQQIRASKPDTPILIVESIIREYSYFNKTNISSSGVLAQNKELRQSFDSAVNIGIKNLFYLEGRDLIGSDHEATIDGLHLSDLGQYRIAELIGAKISEILKLNEDNKRR